MPLFYRVQTIHGLMMPQSIAFEEAARIIAVCDDTAFPLSVARTALCEARIGDIFRGRDVSGDVIVFVGGRKVELPSKRYAIVKAKDSGELSMHGGHWVSADEICQYVRPDEVIALHYGEEDATQHLKQLELEQGAAQPKEYAHEQVESEATVEEAGDADQ